MAGINTHALVLASLNQRTGVAADLGAGQGALTTELARRGFEVYACDICERKFRPNGRPKVHFQCADLNKSFPYADSLFDYVCAIELIEHLENPRHFLRECHRTLKPDGIVILTTPNILNIASHLSLILRGSFIYFSQKEYHLNHHITPVRLQDFQNMFAEIGFRLLKVEFNAGKLPIPKLRHRLPLLGAAFRNRWFGESLLVWAAKH